MDSREIWPPPPNIPMPPVAKEVKAQWFRPALWLGLAFNALACLPAIELLKYPAGADLGEEAMKFQPLHSVVSIAALAFTLGFPVTLWQIRKRCSKRHSIFWECVSCLFYITPFFVGWAVLLVVLHFKDFDSF